MEGALALDGLEVVHCPFFCPSRVCAVYVQESGGPGLAAAAALALETLACLNVWQKVSTHCLSRLWCSSSSFFWTPAASACETNRVLRCAPMPPARASPGWSPSRAVLAGRDAPARARARAALREAHRGARRSRGGPLWAGSSRAADDADAQLKLVPGQPQGQPHPTYFRPRRPRASPTRPRPSGDPSTVLATAAGAWRAHVQR